MLRSTTALKASRAVPRPGVRCPERSRRGGDGPARCLAHAIERPEEVNRRRPTRSKIIANFVHAASLLARQRIHRTRPRRQSPALRARSIADRLPHVLNRAAFEIHRIRRQVASGRAARDDRRHRLANELLSGFQSSIRRAAPDANILLFFHPDHVTGHRARRRSVRSVRLSFAGVAFATI